MWSREHGARAAVWTDARAHVFFSLVAVLSSPEVVDVNRSRENLFFSDDPSFCSSGGYVPRGLRDATVVPPITSSPPWVILRLATGETPEESPGENCPLFRAFRADGRDGRSGECIREEQESRAPLF